VDDVSIRAGESNTRREERWGPRRGALFRSLLGPRERGGGKKVESDSVEGSHLRDVLTSAYIFLDALKSGGVSQSGGSDLNSEGKRTRCERDKTKNTTT